MKLLLGGVFLILLATQAAADEWMLARFMLDRFSPTEKKTLTEKAAMTWDDKTREIGLVIKQGPIKPMLLLSILPQQLPGFEKYRQSLEKEDSQSSKLVAGLIEQAQGRRLQFIGEPGSGHPNEIKVKFGFYPREGGRKLERWGTMWCKMKNQGRLLVFTPDRIEFDSTTAALLWKIVQPRALERIESRIEKARKNKP